jgi:hypothetical protein
MAPLALRIEYVVLWAFTSNCTTMQRNIFHLFSYNGLQCCYVFLYNIIVKAIHSLLTLNKVFNFALMMMTIFSVLLYDALSS